jgi:uncharacterized membrane protein YeaQ/YmgE (transglycosylase-associated protein family)
VPNRSVALSRRALLCRIDGPTREGGLHRTFRCSYLIHFTGHPRPVDAEFAGVDTQETGPMLILAILVFCLFAGWLAQLILGMGTRPNAQSLIAGLVGSFVGGLLASLVAGDGLRLRPSGLIGSVVGAVIVLLVWRFWDERSG